MSDLQKLSKNPSADTRADIAGKVASTLSAGVFNAKESELALDILSALAHDLEVRVRRAISLNLRDAAGVPRALILDLAHDVSEVAVPVLKNSHVLSEEDLIAIVRSTREVVKLVAIAARDSVSSELSEALLDTKVREVVKTVCSNHGAVIRDQHLLKRWEFLAQDRSVLEVLVRRGGLSLTVADKLYSVVGQELKAEMVRMYRLPTMVISEAAEDVHEWATLGMVASDRDGTPVDEEEIEKLVNYLYHSARLTYSIVIRSLCIGDLTFFEMALAKLSGVPRSNARVLLMDTSQRGFKAIYEKAQLPEGFYEAVRTVLKINLEEATFGRRHCEDFRQRVIARIRSMGFDRSIENMQYLLALIGGNEGGGKVAAADKFH